MRGWSAIVGPTHSPKADLARMAAQKLEAGGARVGGFVQAASHDESGVVIGWELLRIPSGDRYPLATRAKGADPTLCEWDFDEQGFAEAARWLSAPGLDCVVIGGIGKLEARHEGHWPAFQRLLDDPASPHALLCVRADVLSGIALSLPNPVAWVEAPAGEREVDELVASILASLELARR